MRLLPDRVLCKTIKKSGTISGYGNYKTNTVVSAVRARLLAKARIAQLGEHTAKFYIWTRLLIENPDVCTVKLKE